MPIKAPAAKMCIRDRAKGVREAVAESGFLGAMTGGLKATAAGVTAAVFLGYIIALVAKPGDKS